MIKSIEIDYLLSLVRAGLWTVHNEGVLYEPTSKNGDQNIGSINWQEVYRLTTLLAKYVFYGLRNALREEG